MWEILWKPRAKKAYLELPKTVREAMEPRIDALAQNPRPAGCRKMTGYDALYRIRVGEYRVLYEIRDKILVVIVLWVGTRGDAYKKL